MSASEGETTAIRVRSAYQRDLEPGETVFDEGDPGDKLYIIQSGEIELAREGAEAPRVVARLGPGDFFGELGVVLGKPCTTRAVAVRRTRLLELDRETLEAMCLEQPAIAIRLLRVVVSRLIEAERRLAALGVSSAPWSGVWCGAPSPIRSTEFAFPPRCAGWPRTQACRCSRPTGHCTSSSTASWSS